MRKLGISVYPEKSSLAECLNYIDLAGMYGIKRVFTCLLSVNQEKEKVINNCKILCSKAHEYGMEVSVDTQKEVFDRLGASPLDLGIFKEMGVDIIRLDGHFGLFEDIEITKNKYNIKIEYNASSTIALDLMIASGANKTNMCICSNFFPQINTGMGLERFKELNEKYQSLGLNNAAFITSLQSKTHGPWEVYDGLPTLEMHRYLPIDLQLRHLNALGYCNDFIIGNCFASKEELEEISMVDLNKITIKVDLDKNISSLEKEVLECNYLSNRDDCNNLIIRASYPRVIFSNYEFVPRKHNKHYFEKGDVLIVNDNLKHYAGEVIIVLEQIDASANYNLVGHIDSNEQIILDCIKPLYSFKLIGR